MSSLSELQRIDRELSSELVESPFNPAFLHMSSPLKSDYDPFFYLQINGEALWQWRKLNADPKKVFEVLQDNLMKIGYRLLPSSALRVGIAVTSRIGYLTKKIRNLSNGNHRQSVRSGYWCRVAIHPDEIGQGPVAIINELKKKEEELIRENQKLAQELEEKAAELYKAMIELKKEKYGHKGLPIEKVGILQQQRHMKEIREKAQKALCFEETYGITLKTLELEDSTGKPITVDLNSEKTRPFGGSDYTNEENVLPGEKNIGVEKKNDDLRRYYHRKINRWDAATNLLLVEKRQEVLREKQRNKRPYEKKSTSFWIDGGKQESARKVPRISTIPESTQLPPAQLPPTQLPPAQLPTMQLPPAQLPPTQLLPAQQIDKELNDDTLRKKKVPELIKLFQTKSGKTLNKRTRKQDIIAALLQYSQRSE